MIIGIYYFVNPDIVLYGLKIKWSYIPAHLFFAVTHISMGAIFLYKENFPLKNIDSFPRCE